MDTDDRTRAIMERTKQRQAELEFEEGKENSTSSPVKKSLEVPAMRASPMKVKETNVDEDVSQGEKKKEARRSVFAELAEEYDEFSHQVHQKPRFTTKEDFVKGKSPRLSIGETRPSVLCTPAGFAAVSRSPNKIQTTPKNYTSPSKTTVTPRTEEETRQIRFAHPISTTTTYNEDTITTCVSPSFNESSIVAGHLSDNTFHSVNSTVHKSEITINESQDCGAHLFIRKKTPTKSPSASSLKIGSPQPFIRGASSSSFSRVLFNPAATSSPKADDATPNASVVESSLLNTAAIQTPASETSKTTPLAPRCSAAIPEAEAKNMSPVRLAAKESAAAKNIAHMLEERIKGTPKADLPMPKTAIYSTASAPAPPQPATQSPVLTQWRGATNTPVVVGATPGQPTRPDVRAANLKNLKNRWEFSSITGTPLHPDETEDDLVKAAMRMRENATPKVQKVVAKAPIHQRSEAVNRSATSSPAAKSPRCDGRPTMPSSNSSPFKAATPQTPPVRMEEPDEVITEDLLDEEESIEESEPNYSRAIDDAFEFMDGSSPTKTPSRPAPLATPEATPAIVKQKTPPKPERNFTEDRLEHVQEQEDQNAGLQYTISFYRKRTRQEQAPTPNAEKIALATPSASYPTQQVIGGTSFLQSAGNVEEVKRRLQETVYAQKTKIHQASKALQLCRNREEFRGSHEEATAQWAVLIETEIGRAAESELHRLSTHGPVSSDGPLGHMTLSYIAVELNRDFVDTYAHIRSSNLFYFCIILRSADKVIHTAIVSSEEAVKKGAIEVVNEMTLKELSTNFTASLDIYSFRTVRGQYTHEEKFGLKGSMKSKGTTRQVVAPPAASDSSFQLVGRLALDIHVPNGKKRLLLSDVRHPLEGHITIKMKKRAMNKSTTRHSGFLSMFQRTTGGLGSWNRYWCVLEEGGMKFWARPEDEVNGKNWLVLLDLQTCAGDKEGATEAKDPCQYRHSINIDVWIPKEGHSTDSMTRTGRPEVEKLRVMLAADTKDDMRVWLDNINTTVKQLLTWNQPFAFAM